MTETEFNNDRKLAIFTVEGDLGLQKMLSLLNALHHQPEFDGSYRVLCDYSRCNWAPMLEEFRSADRSVVDLLNRQQPKGVVAFVLRSETERQIMEHLNRDYPWTTSWATFQSRDLALDWLLQQEV